MRSLAHAVSMLIALAPMMRAQVERGAIRGTVKDDAGHALGGVQLLVKNTDIRTISDTAGGFMLVGVWPGATDIEARRILFQMNKMSVVVKSGDTVRVDITMLLTSGESPVTLGRVETNATSVSSRMTSAEQRRARGGGGSYITRADIERRHPNVLSDMLRGVSGVSIGPSTTSGPRSRIQMERSSGIGSGTCEVQLYVDGQPYLRGNVDDFPPETVEGLEVFRGGAQLPPEFRAQNASCGLIAIWTRDPAAIKRQPESER